MLTEFQSEQKDIYIIFLSTNTYMGRGIRFFTRNRYSHVTIALDRNLSRMYSFARYRINSPILGGFVIEQPLRYLYDNQDVSVKICRLRVSSEEHDRIRDEIGHFMANKDNMIYNTPNALLSLFGRRLTVKDMFTCLEFVTYLLQYPKILTLRELEQRLEKQVIYSGSLRQIVSLEKISPEDEYFNRRAVTGILADTVHHIRKVAVRVLSA